MLGVARDMCQALAKFENPVVTSFNFYNTFTLTHYTFGACKLY